MYDITQRSKNIKSQLQTLPLLPIHGYPPTYVLSYLPMDVTRSSAAMLVMTSSMVASEQSEEVPVLEVIAPVTSLKVPKRSFSAPMKSSPVRNERSMAPAQPAALASSTRTYKGQQNRRDSCLYIYVRMLRMMTQHNCHSLIQRKLAVLALVTIKLNSLIRVQFEVLSLVVRYRGGVPVHASTIDFIPDTTWSNIAASRCSKDRHGPAM